MAAANPHPRVAVVAIISDEQGRVVIGRRIGPLGGGQWAFPGGHLEYGEGIFACVERETLEETGLVVRGIKIVGVTNDVFVEANKHYITMFAKCVRQDDQQQPQRLEPNKCHGWTWKSWDEIKAMVRNFDAVDNGTSPKQQLLFLPVINLVRDNPQIDLTISSADTESTPNRARNEQL